MSNVVAIENYNTSKVASTLFTGQIASGGSASRTLFTVDADPHGAAYNRAATLGIYISVDGVLRTGAELITAVATLANGTRAVRATTGGVGYTLTLMPIASVPTNTILYINFAVDGGGDLTLDGNGAELINLAATLVLTSVGITRLKSNGTKWVTI